MKKGDYRTSIMMSKETRDRLAEVGKKKETFEQIIIKLLDHYHNFTISPSRGKKRNGTD
jgi:hypothetical protein